MFTREFLEKVREGEVAKTCPYCGIGNRKMVREFVGTECDGMYVMACEDVHACCRRANGGPLPWDSDYRGEGAIV